jgi:hypothetical protein
LHVQESFQLARVSEKLKFEPRTRKQLAQKSFITGRGRSQTHQPGMDHFLVHATEISEDRK